MSRSKPVDREKLKSVRHFPGEALRNQFAGRAVLIICVGTNVGINGWIVLPS
ncbi:hypothetical protein GIW45_04065 [Pseudomonas congelans]|uniref:hypothetical protein n=1 Tax=Pseudomonas congelans TaxID=200452 RepID=UPI00031FDB75|nr:hypothetical protein [Pseudomonas congelans]MCF5163293.1 hypothetical protein [Pseudomonas congelans]